MIMMIKDRDRDRKLEVLLAIEGYIRKRGYSPTVREIGKLVGLRSTSTVQRHLVEMEIIGVIERQRSFPRTLAITKKGREIIEAYEVIGT
ncbi:MAG: hypothetical protein JJT76_14635 [Clostridiaceae bacterium]|nr:hypothetical protein [Clostridiaceae bacterium]